MKFEFEKEKMKDLRIAAIFLFGSQAIGAADRSSDFDFAVLLDDRNVLSDYRLRNRIYNELYDIFSARIKRLCNIDIVFLQTTDLQFRYHVAKDGILLYMGNQKIVSDFLENTMESYADFAPLRRQFHEAILQRI